VGGKGGGEEVKEEWDWVGEGVLGCCCCEMLYPLVAYLVCILEVSALVL